MKKLIAIFISISFVVGCGNDNATVSSGQKKDSSMVEDTNKAKNSKYNPADPPVYNSQY